MNKERNYLYIRRLKECIELKIGYSLQTPKDFLKCRSEIFNSLHDTVSVSTLKRVWGYVGTVDDYKPSLQSLNILSAFVGHNDFTSFCSVCTQNENNSIVDTILLLDSISTKVQEVEKELDYLRKHLKCNSK